MLQDYDQLSFTPLPERGLLEEEPVAIDGSWPLGTFLGDDLVEEAVPEGIEV